MVQKGTRKKHFPFRAQKSMTWKLATLVAQSRLQIPWATKVASSQITDCPSMIKEILFGYPFPPLPGARHVVYSIMCT